MTDALAVTRLLVYGITDSDSCVKQTLVSQSLSQVFFPINYILLSSLVYDIYLSMRNLPACVLDSLTANTRTSLRLPKG